MKQFFNVREAADSDVGSIASLLKIYSEQQVVLARDEEDIRLYLGNFVVCVVDGAVHGCVAVRDFGSDLLEVRSLVVEPEFQGKGIGRSMIEEVIAKLKIKRDKFRLFALTKQPDFFVRMGFKIVSRELFPQKIWTDCSKCPKLDCCDEVAMLLDVQYVNV